MFFARIILAVQALIMGGLGLAYWLRPYEMANLNGMLLMESLSVSSVRVYYGGLQLGLAIFLLWSMRQPERARPALMLVLMTQLALALARLGSLWLDGGTLQRFDLTSLLSKLLMAGLAALAFYLLGRASRRVPSALAEAEAEVEVEIAGVADETAEPLRRALREVPAESLEFPPPLSPERGRSR